MVPYNVKVITFPDLTRQVRVYSSTVIPPFKFVQRSVRDRNPFDGKACSEILCDLDGWQYHVDAVSLSRTKRKIYDLARSNIWDWFVTFTFDSKKVDRYDYDSCVSKLSKWFNNLKRSSPGLAYLVVPERHKDGAWHFHGLFSGLDEDEVVWSGRYVVKRVRGAGRSRFIKTSEKIYQIGRYKLGWMTATRVRHKDRVTSYITKYVTKDMLDGLYGRKRYWSSRNLLVPSEEVFDLDEVDRFILGSDLAEKASFQKVSSVSYGDMTQSVSIFEL